MSTWRKQRFEAELGVTEHPPGPNLAALAAIGRQKIYVTSPHYDNIGTVLSSLGIEFEPFRGYYDCDLLFINCGTGDPIDNEALEAFVRGGGCVYASDLESSRMGQVFPRCFTFSGSGSSCRVSATIVDEELAGILGPEIDITFDMGGWSKLESSTGATLLASKGGTVPEGLPLMIELEYGAGAVFYTSFHNQAQNSQAEQALLQLLVLKQLGAKGRNSIAQVSRSLGVSLDRIGAKAR